MQTQLCPAQQTALDRLVRGIRAAHVCVLWGGTGMGKSTVLREAHRPVSPAVETVLANRQRFEEAQAGARQQHGRMPPWAMLAAMSGHGEETPPLGPG